MTFLRSLLRATVPCGFAAGFLLSACDSGDIPERTLTTSTQGRTAKLTATLSVPSPWPDDYRLVLAAFANGNPYALVQRALPLPASSSPVSSPSPASEPPVPGDSFAGSPLSLTLTNIPSEATTVELAVTNRLRQRVLTLASHPLGEQEDTLRLNLGTLRADPSAAIQCAVFDQACIQCHGQNGRKAANLDLTSDHSLANLVNHPSTTHPDQQRIAAGKSEASLLYLILNEGGENLLHYNHTEILTSQFKDNLQQVRTLLRDWINALSPLPIENK